MIFPTVVLLNVPEVGQARPTHVLAVEFRGVEPLRPGRTIPRDVRSLVAYRVLPGRANRAGTVICRAIKVGEIGHFDGAAPEYARPGGVEAAASSPTSGDLGDRGRRVDFWRVAPLARLGSAVLRDSIGLGGWLPGRRAFAAFERPGPPDRTGVDLTTGKAFSVSHPLGYATRVLSPEGKTLAYLPRTLEIVGSPPPGPLLAIRHSMPDADVVVAEHDFDPTRMARAIAAGGVRFFRLDAAYRPVAAVPWRRAMSLLLGPKGDLRSLAVVASPSAGLVGYARNWAVVRAGELGPRKDSYYGWVYDQLGFPKARARYVRGDGDVRTSDYAVGLDGSLLIGGGHTYGGELSCVAVAPGGRRTTYRIQGLGSGSATVFWGR